MFGKSVAGLGHRPAARHDPGGGAGDRRLARADRRVQLHPGRARVAEHVLPEAGRDLVLAVALLTIALNPAMFWLADRIARHGRAGRNAIACSGPPGIHGVRYHRYMILTPGIAGSSARPMYDRSASPTLPMQAPCPMPAIPRVKDWQTNGLGEPPDSDHFQVRVLPQPDAPASAMRRTANARDASAFPDLQAIGRRPEQPHLVDEAVAEWRSSFTGRNGPSAGRDRTPAGYRGSSKSTSATEGPSDLHRDSLDAPMRLAL